MCDDNAGLLSSEDWRKGYVKPLGKPWIPVIFANVDGRAFFEGCILLGNTADVEDTRIMIDQRANTAPGLLTNPNAAPLAAAIRGQQYRWPNRTLAFKIDPSVPNQGRIQRAMRHWVDRTTIRFVERTDEPDYINMRRVGSGCASHVGRRGGPQDMILADDCSVGNIIHELGHAVGLWHEQSRSDRNDFVEIVYSKVQANRRANFDQQIENGIDVESYDFNSIMHYSPTAFSIDGSPTIIPRNPLLPGVVLGQREALSDGDVRAVELIYAGMI